MSATCFRCEIHEDDAGDITLHLCPLHAEAETMREILARAIELVSRGASARVVGLGVVDEARSILARIEGKAE